MDLKDFEYLIALAEEGSVSKAADRLYMAQSSLSQFLQQYESELGVKLFLRTSKGIRPTVNGAVFIDHLKKITEDYRMARGELWDSEGMKGGHVIFGISTFRGKQTLPRILQLFSEQYPYVHVKVVEEHSQKLEDLLLEGKVDVAVIALPATKLKSEVHPLKREEVYLVLSSNHPMLTRSHPRADGHGRWIDLADAAEYPFVLSYHDTILGTLSRSLFQKMKIRYTANFDNISAAMAVAMAKAGIGTAFTYASCVDPDEHCELLRIGEDGVFLDLGVALPTKEYHSTASKAMLEIVRQVYTAE